MKRPHDYVNSYYLATAKGLDEQSPLAGPHDCDVCVIGGGYAGVSAALHLQERGYQVALLEARRIGWGASGRNGGQLGTGLRMEQETLEQSVGVDDARALWELSEEAKRIVRERIARHAIDCDLKPGVLYAAHRKRHAARFREYARRLRERYGYQDTRDVSRDEMNDMLGGTSFYGGILDTGAAHLHPLNLALGLARAAREAGVRMYEHSAVTRYREKGDKIVVTTASGQVTARFAVLACNAYLDNLEPRIAGKIMPINNFMLATEPLGEGRARQLNRDDVAVVDSRFVVNYFRMSPDHRLLFGGGETYTRRFPSDIKAFVRRHMLKIYPDTAAARIDYAWGGSLAVTLNRMPDFGRLGPTIFYTHGFSGHGIAFANLAGKVVAEAIAGTAERFDVVSRVPIRRFPGGRFLRWPGLVLGMFYYSMKDKL